MDECRAMLQACNDTDQAAQQLLMSQSGEIEQYKISDAEKDGLIREYQELQKEYSLALDASEELVRKLKTKGFFKSIKNFTTGAAAGALVAILFL
jgi:DNA repair ATPase RecN